MSNISLNTVKSQQLLNISKKFQIEIIDLLIRWANRFEKVFVSQTAMAKIVGCRRETVNRHLSFLERQGFIQKDRREWDTSIYRLSSIFVECAHVLRRKFRSLKFVWNLSDLASIFTAQKPAPRAPIQKMSHLDRIYIYKYPVDSICTIERVRFRRERTMERVEISRTLKKVTEKLNLTKWGQIKLIQFPDGALEYALQAYNKTTTFNGFFMKALDWCKENNTEPDWTYHYELSEKYKMPKDAKFICKKTPAPTTFAVKELSKASTQFHFEKSRKERKERMKGDKGYEARVSYFQQFKPKFLEEEE